MRHDRIRARISYDAIYKRERVIEEYQLGREDDFFDVLYLHNQNVEYRYNFKTKICTKQQVTKEWRNFGIPSNAKSLGESCKSITLLNYIICYYYIKYIFLFPKYNFKRYWIICSTRCRNISYYME